MSNRLLSKLSNNPILGFITGITAFFAAINGIRGLIGLPLFWSDLLISILFSSITVYWILDSWKESSENILAQTKIKTDAKLKITIKERIVFLGIEIIILPILIGAIIWNIHPVISHFINFKWTLCGQFIVEYPEKTCLLFYDSRERQVSDECHSLDDDSGYKYFDIPNWWTYKPQIVATKNQENVSEKEKIMSKMFDNLNCSGFMKI